MMLNQKRRERLMNSLKSKRKEENKMGEHITLLLIVRMVLIFTGIALFLFVGEPDIHDSIIEVIRSLAN